MKLMDMNCILKSLETFKQDNLATSNVGDSKAKNQSKRRLEAGVKEMWRSGRGK